MLSSSDLPACPACGSREVKPVHELKPREELGETLVDALVAEDPVEHFRQKATRTFYACAGCGRDRTEAWAEIQPPAPVILGVDLAEPGSDRTVEVAKDPPDPNGLGIAATVKNGGES